MRHHGSEPTLMVETRMRRRSWLTAVALLLVPLAAGAKPRPPRSAATIAHLQQRVPELMKLATVPGLSLALIEDGQTRWLHGFGVKDAKTAQPVDEDTIFSAASLSKPVFAYAVLKLVDQGKLGLDVPLTKYLPKRYIEGDARLDAITARIVLSHRTGFRNWRGDGHALKIFFPPGERFSYSGEGIVYLQRVVEQLTAEPLDEAMRELVFTPLGMSSSSYVWRADFDARAAVGHDADGQPRPLGKPPEAVAAASLNTSARDYARFVTAILDGTGLKPATLRELETPQIAVDPECTNCTDRVPRRLSSSIFWGLGWGIERTAQGDSLWHWGDNDVFKCFVVLVPRTRAALVMFTNSENGLSIAPEIFDLGLGGEQPAFAWLKYDRYDSVAMRLARAVHDHGLASALQQYATALDSGAVPEDAINGLGYRLLRSKQNADAIRLFERNVALHPQSANVYDSLAEAYMTDGKKALAIESYQRSLALNPHNDNAAQMLEKLRP